MRGVFIDRLLGLCCFYFIAFGDRVQAERESRHDLGGSVGARSRAGTALGSRGISDESPSSTPYSR